MIPFQFLVAAIGTVLIRFLHVVRRRLSWEKYFSFSDFLVDERHVQSRGFIYMALPPLVGGLVMGIVPGVHPITVAAAGFLAAFIGVWPVFQFPDQLLDEYLLPYWGKLKLLYIIFLGFSTSLAYLGWLLAREAPPILSSVTGTRAWQQFLDGLAANAIYDSAKALAIFIFVTGGLYISRERKRIGGEIDKKREEDWKKEMEEHST
jgi:hypothetical protein